MHRRDDLSSYSIAAQVADHSAIRIIERDVCEGAEFVTMLGSRLSRGRNTCVHNATAGGYAWPEPP